MAAEDIVYLRIKESLQHLSEKRQELQESLSNVMLSEANRKNLKPTYQLLTKDVSEKWSYSPTKTRWHLKQWFQELPKV